MSNTIELRSTQEQNSSISKNTTKEITVPEIQNLIISLPNRPKAMLAKDLAVVYDTEPRRINEAVKRNPKRFPPDFMFQANDDETNFLVSQSAITKESTIKSKPYLFTQFGANQLSTVLHSDIAIERSIQIMRAFSQMEEKKVEQPQLPPSPVNDTCYLTTFHNPTVIMNIKKKNCSDNYSRFIDFGAGAMFPVQPDNSILLSEHQYNKMLEIIGMELKTMVKYGFSNGVFGQKDVKIEDVAGTLPALPPVDKFKKLEESQKMLQIELSAATSQIEEMKALKLAEEAIRTKAQIGDKKVASAMGKAGGLAKQNKKLQQEIVKLKKMLQDKTLFDKK